MRLSPNEVAYLVKKYWWATSTSVPFDWMWETAVAIPFAEGNGETDVMGFNLLAADATKGNVDHGLYQISNYWHGFKLRQMPNWRDPHINTQLAFKVWEETERAKGVGQGFTAWAVYNSEAYVKWLPYAKVGLANPIPLFGWK